MMNVYQCEGELDCYDVNDEWASCMSCMMNV